MLIVGHTARFLPFAIYTAASQVRHVDSLLAEAASLPAVSRWRRFFWITAPLAAPAVVTPWLVVFVFSLGELGVSLLIAPPGEATLPLRIYNLLHYGAADLVAVLSLIVLLLGGGLGAALLVARCRLWGGMM
jgi:iron(III) transport system permease protein